MSALIETTEQLQAFIDQLKGEPFVAIDTEFIRTKTYYARLALIQIASPQHLACIDPLAVDDLSPLNECLQDASVVKIFHAGFQDLENFYHLFGQVPQNVVDTQLMAAALEMGDQIGYAGLVEQLFDVQLDKSQSRTDWLKRPLTTAQVEYASNDVAYLVQAYPMLIERLSQLQRETWLDNSFAEMSSTEPYQVKWDTLWLRVKQHQKLHASQLRYLRALAIWREQHSIAKNLPRKWFVDDECLLRACDTFSQNLNEIHPCLHKKKHYLDDLLPLIEAAEALGKADWPKPFMPPQLSPEQKTLLKALEQHIKAVSESLGLSHTDLAGRKHLKAMIVNGGNQIDNGWRSELINPYIAEFLASHASDNSNNSDNDS